MPSRVEEVRVLLGPPVHGVADRIGQGGVGRPAPELPETLLQRRVVVEAGLDERGDGQLSRAPGRLRRSGAVPEEL